MRAIAIFAPVFVGPFLFWKLLVRLTGVDDQSVASGILFMVGAAICAWLLIKINDLPDRDNVRLGNAPRIAARWEGHGGVDACIAVLEERRRKREQEWFGGSTDAAQHRPTSRRTSTPQPCSGCACQQAQAVAGVPRSATAVTLAPAHLTVGAMPVEATLDDPGDTKENYDAEKKLVIATTASVAAIATQVAAEQGYVCTTPEGDKYTFANTWAVEEFEDEGLGRTRFTCEHGRFTCWANVPVNGRADGVYIIRLGELNGQLHLFFGEHLGNFPGGTSLNVIPLSCRIAEL